jgi:Cu+-exporting ATPase
MFQIKYSFLSFERDFKSYFPIAVRINSDTSEERYPIYDIQRSITNQELIPVDGILISDKTAIDYSFVTGEANPITKTQVTKCLLVETNG